MTHAMLDLETLGRKPGCAILSIGAVAFSPKGVGVIPGTGNFYCNVDLISQLFRGFHINNETLEWWKQQDPRARHSLSFHTKQIWDALAEFAPWCKDNNIEQVWCQGAAFDIPILEGAFEKLGMKAPWKFYNVRDTRTVYDVCGFDYKSIPREGVYHNALDDAIHQVKLVQAALAGRK